MIKKTAALTKLLELPEETQKKMFLYHYSDDFRLAEFAGRPKLFLDPEKLSG